MQRERDSKRGDVKKKGENKVEKKGEQRLALLRRRKSKDKKEERERKKAALVSYKDADRACVGEAHSL